MRASMHKQRGFMDKSALNGLFLVAAAVCVAGGAVAVGGVSAGISYLHTDKEEFRERSKDLFKAQSLTVITLDKFKRDNGCGDDTRKITANFVAKDAEAKVVAGKVCISRDREATLKIIG